MAPLRTERRVHLWRMIPRPVPADADKPVTLAEIVELLRTEFDAKRARVYLSAAGRILDDDAEHDEKNQLYIAQIKEDPKKEIVTFLMNRGDPEAVLQALLNPEANSVRVEPPKRDEVPGWSAHLVISTKAEKGRHRAAFEKMPHVSSSLVLTAIDRIIRRATAKQPEYTFEVVTTRGKKEVKSLRSYRPTLANNPVPSERLIDDLESGELSGVTLTKQKTFYQGVGADELITRQEEKVIIRTTPTEQTLARALIEGIINRAQEEHFTSISFHLDKLPGNMTNNPTIPLSEENAFEALYTRSQRIFGFDLFLDGCYAAVHEPIEAKMAALLKSNRGW